MTRVPISGSMFLTLLALAIDADGDNSPENLHWESPGLYEVDGGPFKWYFDFDLFGQQGAPACGQLTEISGGVQVSAGSLGTDLGSVCPQAYQLAYGDPGDERGMIFDPVALGQSGVEVTRQVFVSATEDLSRWEDRFDGTGGQDQSVVLTLTSGMGGNLFGPRVELYATSSGDQVLDTDDEWAAFDDDDAEGGAPARALVWQGEGAPVRAAQVSFQDALGLFSARFDDVLVPAGQSVTTLHFMVQANTRDGAIALAEDVAVLGGSSTENVDDLDWVVNFRAGRPGAPTIQWNGPFSVAEGAEIEVSATAEDAEGDALTYEWDLDDDGQYDDSSGALVVTVSAANVDGPATMRVGLRVTDTNANATARTATIPVENVPPRIGSEPGTTARTGVEYRYAIAATDFVADVLTFEIEEGPDGMTVNDGGVVTWTPAPDGSGPEESVRVVVRDDDGGETPQSWVLQIAGAPGLDPGGPYAVDEGGEVVLTPVVTDPEGDEVSFAWDLDGDGEYDDAATPAVTWSAAGIDGPNDDHRVALEISDGEFRVRSSVPVAVRNAPPEFLSEPPPIAVVEREWLYAMEIRDPGNDPITVELDDDAPDGVELLGTSLRWAPTVADLETEDVSFTVTAEDDDGGRSRQQIELIVRVNSPPPPPEIAYPTGEEAVRTGQPTFILENVDDPDGDPVSYHLLVDTDICFCSPDRQASNALAEGDLVTQWPLPVPLPVATHDTFYVRRWTSDGLAASEERDSLFRVEIPVPDAGVGTTPAPADPRAGCACRTGGPVAGTDRSFLLGLQCAAGLALALSRRRRRRSPAPRQSGR